MDRPGTCGSALQGATEAHPLPEPHRGGTASGRVATAPVGHGAPGACHRTARVQHHGHALGSGRFGPTDGLGASRPSQGKASDSGATQWRSHGRAAKAARQARRARVHVPGQPSDRDDDEGVVQRREAGQRGAASLPRSAAHLCVGHVQQGTPLSVLQELGGWQSSAMVSRYAHLGAEHLAPWTERLATHGTNTAQPPHEPSAITRNKAR